MNCLIFCVKLSCLRGRRSMSVVFVLSVLLSETFTLLKNMEQSARVLISLSQDISESSKHWVSGLMYQKENSCIMKRTFKI